MRGVILDVSPDGRARIDFGPFRVAAQLPVSVRAGDSVQVRVTGIGNPIYLKLEAPAFPAAVSPSAAEPLRFPDPFVWQAFKHPGMAEFEPSAMPGDTGRIQVLLDRLRQHLAPLSMSDPTERIAARLADKVENSGVLLEKRLEGVLRHLLTGSRTPDLSALDRHPWIRSVLAGDAKSLVLRLESLIRGAGPSDLISATTRLLEDIVSRQQDAVRHHHGGSDGAPSALLTYPARPRAATASAARIGAWTADLVARVRLGARQLPASGQAALTRMASAAEQLEMLAPVGHLDPTPIQRLLIHARILLALPGTVTAKEGQTALALIGSLNEAFARPEKLAAGRSTRKTVASLRRLAGILGRMGGEELPDVARRLGPLADRLEAGAPADKRPEFLASDIIGPALSELKNCLQVHQGSLPAELQADLERLQHRVEGYLTHTSGGNRDGDSDRGASQVLAFTLPLAQTDDPAKLKIHFTERRPGGRSGERHISLLLNFEHLGKVRADLHLRPPDLNIRFAVTEERTRKRLQGSGPALVAVLKPYFRDLDISAALSVEHVARFELREPPPAPGHAVNLNA